MAHTADVQFWRLYRELPSQVQSQADKAFALIKSSPDHPSLKLKKVKGHKGVWSARVSLDYRVLALEADGGLHWFWIGNHAD